MVQTDTVLDKSLVRVFGRASLYADRGPSTHVVEKVVAVIDLRHAQEGQQFGIERVRLLPPADSQDHVSHAIDFNH